MSFAAALAALLLAALTAAGAQGPAQEAGVEDDWYGTITWTIELDRTSTIDVGGTPAGGRDTETGTAVFTMRGDEPPLVDIDLVYTYELIGADSSVCEKSIERFDFHGSVDAAGEPIAPPRVIGPLSDGRYSILLPELSIPAMVTECGQTSELVSRSGWELALLPPGSAPKDARRLVATLAGIAGPPVRADGTLSWNLTRSEAGTGSGSGAPPPPPAQTFTDTFTAPGQAKPHAVTIPAAAKTVDLTIRWPKAGDAFDAAGFVVVRGGKVVARGPAAYEAEPRKLKITKLKITKTSVTIRVSRLVAGKLKFKVVAKKVSGTTKVTTRVKRR